jgi:hypothetical protein
MAMYHVEPFGDAAANYRHGIATAALANINRDSKQRPEPYLATDFMLAQVLADAGPELLANPEAQSRRIKQAIFKV